MNCVSHLGYAGGLRYSVLDVGLACSGAGLMLFLAAANLRTQFRSLVHMSPIRSLRISVSWCLMVCVLLPLILAHSSSVTPDRISHSVPLTLVELRPHAEKTSHDFSWLQPTRSFAGLAVVSLLLGSLSKASCASHERTCILQCSFV